MMVARREGRGGWDSNASRCGDRASRYLTRSRALLNASVSLMGGAKNIGFTVVHYKFHCSLLYMYLRFHQGKATDSTQQFFFSKKEELLKWDSNTQHTIYIVLMRQVLYQLCYIPRQLSWLG